MVALVIAGGLMLLAFGGKRATNGAKKDGGANGGKTEQPAQTPTSPPSSSIEAQIKDIMTNAPALAAGAALLTAERKVTGDAAYALTGDRLSRDVGTAFGLSGVAAVGAAEVTKEVAKVFGGREESASTQIAQVTVGSLIVLGGGGGAGVLFLLSIPGLQLVGAIFLLAATIEDANRLAYGQTGALEDYRKEWLKVYGATVDSLLTNGYKLTNGTVVMPTEAQAQRIAFPVADGYMRIVNELAELRWMRQPWGVGQTESSHKAYGAARGYFVVNPPRYADDSGYAQFIPKSEVTLVTVPHYEFVEEAYFDASLSAFTYFQREPMPQVTNGESVKPLSQSESELKDAGFNATRWTRVQNGTEQRYSDPYRWSLEALGATAANVAQYAAWMRSSKSAFQSELSHLNYGKAEGRFYGDGLSDGKLSYNGVTYDYREIA